MSLLFIVIRGASSEGVAMADSGLRWGTASVDSLVVSGGLGEVLWIVELDLFAALNEVNKGLRPICLWLSCFS